MILSIIKLFFDNAPLRKAVKYRLNEMRLNENEDIHEFICYWTNRKYSFFKRQTFNSEVRKHNRTKETQFRITGNYLRRIK